MLYAIHFPNTLIPLGDTEQKIAQQFYEKHCNNWIPHTESDFVREAVGRGWPINDLCWPLTPEGVQYFRYENDWLLSKAVLIFIGRPAGEIIEHARRDIRRRLLTYSRQEQGDALGSVDYLIPSANMLRWAVENDYEIPEEFRCLLDDAIPVTAHHEPVATQRPAGARDTEQPLTITNAMDTKPLTHGWAHEIGAASWEEIEIKVYAHRIGYRKAGTGDGFALKSWGACGLKSKHSVYGLLINVAKSAGTYANPKRERRYDCTHDLNTAFKSKFGLKENLFFNNRRMGTQCRAAVIAFGDSRQNHTERAAKSKDAPNHANSDSISNDATEREVAEEFCSFNNWTRENAPYEH